MAVIASSLDRCSCLGLIAMQLAPLLSSLSSTLGQRKLPDRSAIHSMALPSFHVSPLFVSEPQVAHLRWPFLKGLLVCLAFLSSPSCTPSLHSHTGHPPFSGCECHSRASFPYLSTTISSHFEPSFLQENSRLHNLGRTSSTLKISWYKILNQ